MKVSRVTFERLKDGLLALTTVATAVTGYFATRHERELEDLRSKSSLQAQENEFAIKAYELVEKALTGDRDRGAANGVAANAIVSSLTHDPLRAQLLSALQIGLSDSTAKSRASAASEFDQVNRQSGLPTDGQASRRDTTKAPPAPGEASLIPPSLFRAPGAVASRAMPAGPLDGFRVDLFYCEASNSALTMARKSRADAARARLVPVITSPEMLRVRLLPILVQARPGYQSFMDEVRYNATAAERAAAQELSKIVAIPAGAMHAIEYSTKNYISVFYCK